MGAMRRIGRRPRGRRVAGVAVLAAIAVGGAVACDPNGLSSASVAFTTDQTATKKLEREGLSVRWLTCTASFDSNGSSAPSATENTVAKVDCQGKTDDGKDISVTGKVTRAVNGACVRGDLTAKVGGDVVFHVNGLGNCDARNTPPVNNPGQPGPTVTVTVTKTIWCQGDPQCWPVEGK
ncbi:hypothetical protein F7R91_15570 [Streptomyces luteolifulvus]|uniref:Lipoprotein n=1 Tax=Streptomyces luteolifulvus TaxID=2615112 RepID=A0A6H9UZ61_9ACTN|nr:hypothetical protein [Streptomyces luteolifulvus]KAB1146343.1 hypothetical protein F7R91_15570 [Streptomyces luteolifulvus]